MSAHDAGSGTVVAYPAVTLRMGEQFMHSQDPASIPPRFNILTPPLVSGLANDRFKYGLANGVVVARRNEFALKKLSPKIKLVAGS